MAFGNATKGYVKKHSGGGGGGGTSNYNELSNKPTINGVTLSGNKTSEDLGISGGGGGSLHSITKSINSLSYTSTNTVNVDLSSLNFTDNNYVVVGYSSDYQNAGLNIELGAKTPTNQTLYIKNLGDRTISPTVTFYIIKF